MRCWQRHANTWIAFLIVLSAVLLGLRPSPADAIDPHDGARKHGDQKHTKQNVLHGKIVVSEGLLPTSLNPLQNGLDALENGLFDSLVLYDRKLKLHPHLATTVPTVQN